MSSRNQSPDAANECEFLTPVDLLGPAQFAELDRGVYGFRVGGKRFPLADHVDDVVARKAVA